MPVVLSEGEPAWAPITLPEAKAAIEKPKPPKLSSADPKVVTVEKELSSDKLVAISTSANSVAVPTLPAHSLEPDVADVAPVSYASVVPNYCAGERAMLAFLQKELQ